MKTYLSLILTALLICIAGITPVSAQNDETIIVRYLPPEEVLGSRSLYYYNMLKLALDKTVESHGLYELVPAEKAMNQRDALKAMMAGKGIDVVHTMTDKTRESVLLPVRIPLVKGLIGVRLFMINNDDKDTFSTITTKADLKKFTYGQGYDWPDTEILKYNELKVNTSNNYQELFPMLKDKKIDTFPRAVFEIWNEIEDHKESGFIVADGFYIYYPAAMYFFVKKDIKGSKLSKRLEAGLRIAIEDGSFDELFNKEMKSFLENANLSKRIGIKLANPRLSEETPINDKSLWYLN